MADFVHFGVIGFKVAVGRWGPRVGALVDWAVDDPGLCSTANCRMINRYAAFVGDSWRISLDDFVDASSFRRIVADG